MKNTRTRFRTIAFVFFVATIISLILSALIETRTVAEIFRTVGLILLGAMVVQILLLVINRHLIRIRNKIDKLAIGRRSV